MKKLFAISLICWLVLHCSIEHRRIIPPFEIVISQHLPGYWLYFRMEDRVAVNPDDSIGRSKKGDLVQVRLVTENLTPSIKEQQEWAIIRVDEITNLDIAKYTESWEDSVTRVPKAYRRWTFDVDALSIRKGLDTSMVDFDSIKVQSSRKTTEMLMGYKKKCQIEKYVYSPLKKTFNWMIPKLYAPETVNTINRTGQDYDTLTLWEDAVDGDITAGNAEVAECYDDDGDLPDNLTINGFTTDADSYVEVRTPSAERHSGTAASGFKLVANNDAILITINDDHVRITGLIIDQDSTDLIFQVNFISSTNDIRISYNIITFEQGSDAILITDTDTNLKYFNNVLYGIGTIVNFIDGFQVNCDSAWVYNNSFFNSYQAFRANAGVVYAKNNLSFGSTFDFSGSFQSTSDFNISADASAPDNGNSILSATIDATNDVISLTSGSEDLHVRGTSSDLYNNGQDLSSDTFLNITDDIVGISRPQSTSYDIGAFELIVSVAATPATKKGIRARWWN